VNDQRTIFVGENVGQWILIGPLSRSVELSLTPRLFTTSVLFSLISHRVTVSTLDFVARYVPALYSRAVIILARYTLADLQPSSEYAHVFAASVTEKSPVRDFIELIPKDLPRREWH